MTKKQKRLFGNDNQSVSRQISQAASRLDRRKRTAKALGLSLGSRIHSTYASPGGLWIAGGAGFLLAEWIHRPTSEPPPVIEPTSKSPSRSQTVAISNAALLLKFVLDLREFWSKESPGAPVRGEATEAEVAE